MGHCDCIWRKMYNYQELPERVDLLDHGYIQLIEYWGSDIRIIESARMSTDKGFLGWEPEVRYQCETCNYRYETDDEIEHVIDCPNGHGRLPYKLVHRGDERLLSYLYKNHHTTPFEMAGITVEVQAPIVVFREWHRHRTQSYNELSARYTPLPDLNYVPTPERCLQVHGTNKQAGAVKGSEQITTPRAMQWLAELESLYRHAQEVYDLGLQMGIPKEVARLPVPVGRYSRMRASGNLLNWLRFLTLRQDEKAQWEIRQYANEVARIIEWCFPRTHRLYIDRQ